MAAKDHVAVRLDTPTTSRLEALRLALSEAWHPATQSDVLRAAILAGLDVLEEKHQIARGATGPRKKRARASS